MSHTPDKPTTATTSEHRFDVLLIGAGIMSTTLGSIITELEPSWSVGLVEKLDGAGQESSDPWNNAGTGHAALCELNYTPRGADGSISTAKAQGINEQFRVSQQLWSHWVNNGTLGSPRTFINALPHISFVWGDENAQYLQDRRDAMAAQPLFSDIEHTEDLDTINSWAPLLTEGREAGQRVAASRFSHGTDVDFGAQSRQLTAHLESAGADIRFGHEVTSVSRGTDGRWSVTVKPSSGKKYTASARFLFVGAGGGALGLLQSSGIKEIRGIGGFPVSGKFLRTNDQAVADQHHAKVYGLASTKGAPPMSVPHLDTRFVEGRRNLMFGPYAGFSTNFLKKGSFLDLPLSVRPHNLTTMTGVGISNLELVSFLVKEVAKSQGKKVEELRRFYPEAAADAWELITAGQRVQVMKRGADGKPVLQFGTELVASDDGSIAGLLGASPGASTAPSIMLGLLERCFPAQIESWKSQIEQMVPSYGRLLNDDPALLAEVDATTAKTLQLDG